MGQDKQTRKEELTFSESPENYKHFQHKKTLFKPYSLSSEHDPALVQMTDLTDVKQLVSRSPRRERAK